MQKNVIYYFTGTGNSFAVAKDIANVLDDTQLISVSKLIKNPISVSAFDRIGFVFPTYYQCMPPIMERFITSLTFTQSQYLFGVITFAGVYGTVLAQLSELIHNRGGKLSTGFAVRMPGNYITSYSAFPQKLQEILFKRSKRKVLAITSEIVKKEVNQIPRGSAIMRASQTASQKILNSFGEKARNFRVNENCIGCGICCRICPDENIKIDEGKPTWGNMCEQCMACIQWCPHKAIEYSNKTEKRTRYRHPEVDVTDIISKT